MSLSHRLRGPGLFLTSALAMSLALSGCAVGPDYQRPSMATPPAFKEAQGWTAAVPEDGVDRGDWWTLFNDPVLNDLEAKVNISNQNLKASEAAYRQARALVAQDRASLFPSLDLSGSGTRSKSSTGSLAGRTITTGFSTGPTNSYQGALGASWEPDLWGKLRRTVEER